MVQGMMTVGKAEELCDELCDWFSSRGIDVATSLVLMERVKVRAKDLGIELVSLTETTLAEYDDRRN